MTYLAEIMPFQAVSKIFALCADTCKAHVRLSYNISKFVKKIRGVNVNVNVNHPSAFFAEHMIMPFKRAVKNGFFQIDLQNFAFAGKKI